MTDKRKLTRSEEDKIIAGICGGLGEFFAIDPVIMRILFVVLALADGIGILVYVIMWLIVPTQTSTSANPTDTINENAKQMGEEIETFAHKLEEKIQNQESEQDTTNETNWFGIALVVIGIWFLLENFGFGLHINLGRLWPVILIAAGGYFILQKND